MESGIGAGRLPPLPPPPPLPVAVPLAPPPSPEDEALVVPSCAQAVTSKRAAVKRAERGGREAKKEERIMRSGVLVFPCAR